MKRIFLLFIAYFIAKPQLTFAIRCQCTTDKGGIPCYNGWCQVYNNGTKEAACALLRIGSAQHFACARVSGGSEDDCTVDTKNGRTVTKCWCRNADYCNVDLSDRVSEDKPIEESEEEDGMVIDKEYDVNDQQTLANNYDISEEVELTTINDKTPQVVDLSTVVNQIKSQERISSKSEESLPPWRRTNPINSVEEWAPPPPPPMPNKQNNPPPPPTTTTKETTVTITTTTTAPHRPPPPQRLSYEEELRRYEEEVRRMRNDRERELQRREEERKRIESQYESRRRFGESRSNWPIPVVMTTTTQKAITTEAVKPETRTTLDYEKYYRSQYQTLRKQVDTVPSPISISKFNAIVYPPKNFQRASSTTTTPTSTSTITTTTSTTSSTSTTTTTTSTTTTTTPAPTTTTTTPVVVTTTTTLPPTTKKIIYPPANFRQATKQPPTTSSSTTTTTTTIKSTTPEEEEFKEMPTSSDQDYNDEDVIMYTPPSKLIPIPTEKPIVRPPVDKMNEYKKLLEPSSSYSCSIILSFAISFIIFYHF